ncbi:MAG: hypothetical protein ETSY1_36530 [Candidatus Entotheonella factor]|uniref:HTH lysR-type domain-containing protein n=1 Tax=Entotheonella factor TaxID=1429438 RepID=W4L8M5_ENTF1|nr:LysR family transcriptional regulator [Candidatus Entotheonella palauensis]ETW94050.1 MAG: hypothetical protein ETSY1_36530 [Candidatus Entotheonella factor]
MNFELQHLRTFVAVAEAGSVTGAAKRLYLSPPAVSAHIQKLEDELQVPLFVRTSQGMEVTAQGQVLRAKAEQALQAAQNVVRQAAELQSEIRGRVTFGINASPQVLRLAPIIQHLHTEYPGIDLALVHSATGKILEALRSGTLDIGFVFGPVTDRVLVAHRLGMIDLVIAVPQRFASQVPQVDWAAMAKLPWLYSDGYCPFQDMIDTCFAARGLRAQRVVETNDEATKCDLVRAGIGLALLDREEANALAAAGAAVIREPEPMPCDLSLVYAAQRADDPLIQAIAGTVCLVWAP